MSRTFLVAAALAAVIAAPGQTAPAEYKPIRDEKSITLDPAKSYLLVQIDGDVVSSMSFVRRPDTKELEEHSAKRAEALAKARAKWVTAHASWKDKVASWSRLSRQHKEDIPRPVEPVEPTDENFNYPSFEQLNMFVVGPLNRFAKGGGRSVYLHMVKAGRYAFYGTVDLVAGSLGTCMCMGTFEFEVKPGQIVDIGKLEPRLLIAMLKANDEGKPAPKSDFDLPDGSYQFGWKPPSNGERIDPRLSAYTIVSAELRASGPFTNFLGVLIDRLAPIPGTLEYQRDRIIDPKVQTSSAQ